LTTFQGPGTIRAGKVENQVRMIGFAPETYPHFLESNSYIFPSVRSKNVSVEFWRLFKSGHHWSMKSWKLGLDDLV